METVYLGIVIFLFMLAVFDLLVGVSNDAVNFMKKVAKFRTIIIVAAAGVFLGAIMSNGMMDIARHGIFQPSNFSFYEIMCILLAVMVTDVVLLDVFNTLGLPTSTTVSMVFELLGGTFILAILKILGDETGMYSLGDMMNTEKAFSVIMAIFLSVAIAFIAGTVVQYISRLIFSFNYKKNLSWTIGIFGGLSTTALAYFILLQGLKSSPYISPETLEWISDHNSLLILGCFIFFTLLMQVLHWCKVNVFRIIVLLGTFSLALAFAGNDLVNFIIVYGLCDKLERRRHPRFHNGLTDVIRQDPHDIPLPFGLDHGICPGYFQESAKRNQDLGRPLTPRRRRRNVRLVRFGKNHCTTCYRHQ